MKFKVRAISKDGDTYNDILDVADRFAAYREIRDRGDRVLALNDESAKGVGFLALFTDIFTGISLDEKAMFARNLAAMLEAGLTIFRALDVMKRQTRNTHLKKVLVEVMASVKKGDAFSAALGAYPAVFSSLLVSMVRAGEESGKLTESLRVAAIQMERASNLEKKVRGALIYPAVVLSAMVGIAILMLVFVVPTLSSTFSELNASLPPTTLALIGASAFLTGHPILAFGALALLFLAFFFALRTQTGKDVFDWLMLKTPIIGNLIVEIHAARTTRTLASLFGAGVDMVFSVRITRDVLGNVQYKKILAEAEVDLSSGSPLSTSFGKHPDLYPPLVTEIIAVGEETGRLSELLKETAEFYEESVERQTKDLSTVIEPFLMIIIGVGVGFFALSMIAPIYSLSNSI